jgi:hypothetical protein
MQVMLRVEEIRAAGPSTPVNLSVMFHSITNSVVSRAAFGKKRKNAAEFLAATKAVVGLSSGFNIPDLFPTWTPILAKLTGMDVDVLIGLQEKGGFGFQLTNSIIKAIILVIL